MRIYALYQVTEDYYNPRLFLAAYSTKEKAERAKAYMESGNAKAVTWEIEEVELDDRYLDG